MAVEASKSARWPVPHGACDCHTHVFPDAHPFDPARTYTPPTATIDELGRHLGRLGLARVVLVQASVHGFDNGAALSAMAAFGPDRARGVAVVPDDVADSELARLHAAGMRGVRLAYATATSVDPARAEQQIRRFAVRLSPLGWHLQIYASLETLLGLRSVLADLPVPVVLDHFAGARAAGGLDQPGFADVLALVRAGKAYVKLSSAYRISTLGASGYPDVLPLARTLIEAGPERVLWGSDWPHPDAHGGRHAHDISPALPVDDGAVFARLADWAGSEATYRAILRDNPARLYGFPPA